MNIFKYRYSMEQREYKELAYLTNALHSIFVSLFLYALVFYLRNEKKISVIYGVAPQDQENLDIRTSSELDGEDTNPLIDLV